MGQQCCCPPDGGDLVEMPVSSLPKVTVGKRGKAIQAQVAEESTGVMVTGDGSCLANTVIEQDAAYWEVDVQDAGQGCCIGVCREPLGNGLDSLIQAHPQEAWMYPTDKLKSGDTVSVMFGQDDLPNLRFLVNGKEDTEASVKRIGGDVYPVFGTQSGVLVIKFEPEAFRLKPPHSRHVEIRPPRKML
eukprot:TRINITY_DN12318_c0_g1_i1.p1 TRINITY_DN12318_c0_g1~~TRINITY_DN12318_c0_g1_i1.p1  ORF type:complete len:188 (+),score=31.44 TRINITY_DN12318_c0_g1_i1:94-657(+)